jgi:hypothetical protein
MSLKLRILLKMLLLTLTLTLVEVVATTILRSKSQSGWPLQIIHISNNNGFFLRRLLPELTIWVTQRVSDKKQELLTLHEFSRGFFCGICVAPFALVFCVALLCVFMLWVRCCDVRYDFHIKTMFGSSLPPFVCSSARVLFTLFVFSYV